MYDDEIAPSNWWELEETLSQQNDPLLGFNYSSPDYSLSSGKTEGLEYNLSGPSSLELAEPSGQGEGIKASDFSIDPETKQFVYTGGGGTGEGMSFPSTTGSGTYAGLPTSVSGSSSAFAGILDALKGVGGKLLDKATTAGGKFLDNAATPEGLLNLWLLSQLAKTYANPSYGKAGYQGKINMNLEATRPRLAQAERAYGQGAQGQSYFGPTTYAAHGGIMDLARGGSTRRDPRYLDGPTDGMADQINTSIDDAQPAKLSHGEFVIPADVVSHLGNGNSSAGAKVLYSMMAKVRKARTGNKKQGKQINPSKFMPGGIAAYADGGAVAFEGGGPVPVTAATPVVADNLAPWAGDYVTDMLSRARAESVKPYEAYTGQLTAGYSPLQERAFKSAETMPSLAATEFKSQFAAPTSYSTGVFANQFVAPTDYKAGTFTNLFADPAAYKAGTYENQFNVKDYETTQFDTGLGQVKDVEDYISPYMQNVVNVQAAAARRQAELARIAEAQRMTRAGGYGGSRQAILEAEGTRNLQTLLDEIQAKGSQSAYEQAVSRRMSESEASMNAQRAEEASKQFGAGQKMTAAELRARYGFEGQKAADAARQFAATYGLNVADTRAKYALAGQQEAERARQFGATQGMTAAELKAKYGLASKQAEEESRQFGATYGLNASDLAAKYALEAQRSSEASKAASARYGLEALQAQAALGAEQRAIEQKSLDALKAQFEEQRIDPFNKLMFQKSMLSGLPIGATGVETSGLQDVNALVEAALRTIK